jgi:hypothetical protein
VPRRADKVDNVVGTLMEYEKMTMDLEWGLSNENRVPLSLAELRVTGSNEFNLMETLLRGL